MALLTAGTKLTTSLSALVWQPGGLNTTDLATLQESIVNPAVNVSQKTSARIEDGILHVPGQRTPGGYVLKPGDYIMVDGAGWPIVVPASIFSTSWQHS